MVIIVSIPIRRGVSQGKEKPIRLHPAIIRKAWTIVQDKGTLWIAVFYGEPLGIIVDKMRANQIYGALIEEIFAAVRSTEGGWREAIAIAERANDHAAAFSRHRRTWRPPSMKG